MANLKEIRIRLNSVKSTRQITSAMKMVSAAKLRKAQEAIVQMRPFAGKLQEIQRSVSAAVSNDASENVFLQPGASDRVLLVVISSTEVFAVALIRMWSKKHCRVSRKNTFPKTRK